MDAAFPAPVTPATAKAAPNAAPGAKASEDQSHEGGAFDDHLSAEETAPTSPLTALARRTGASAEKIDAAETPIAAAIVAPPAPVPSEKLAALAVTPATAALNPQTANLDMASPDQAPQAVPPGQVQPMAASALAATVDASNAAPVTVSGSPHTPLPENLRMAFAPQQPAKVTFPSVASPDHTQAPATAPAQSGAGHARDAIQAAAPVLPAPSALLHQIGALPKETGAASRTPGQAPAGGEKSARHNTQAGPDAIAASISASAPNALTPSPQTASTNGAPVTGTFPASQGATASARPNSEASLLVPKAGEQFLIFLPAAQPQAASSPMQVGPAAYAQPTDLVPLPDLGAAIAHRAEAGLSRFEIRLDPPELGRLDIALEFNDEGAVKAHVRADRPEALELLQREARGLEQALRQAGMTLASDGLSFSLGHGAKGQSHNENGQRNTRHFKAVIEDDAKINAALNPSVSASAGLDMHV